MEVVPARRGDHLDHATTRPSSKELYCTLQRMRTRRLYLANHDHAAHPAAPAPCGQSRRMCGGPSRVCDRLSRQAHARKQVRDTRRHRRWVIEFKLRPYSYHNPNMHIDACDVQARSAPSRDPCGLRGTSWTRRCQRTQSPQCRWRSRLRRRQSPMHFPQMRACENR
jgi:hypothetical protein